MKTARISELAQHTDEQNLNAKANFIYQTLNKNNHAHQLKTHVVLTEQMKISKKYWPNKSESEIFKNPTVKYGYMERLISVIETFEYKIIKRVINKLNTSCYKIVQTKSIQIT